MAHLPPCASTPRRRVAAGHGRVLGPAGIDGPYAVFAPDGRLVGVCQDDGPRSKPLVVLAAD